MKNKSEIKLFIADNGNFNITTDWGVIGLYNSWSCCESWTLRYNYKKIWDNYDDDFKEQFVNEFNNHNLEIEKKQWDELFEWTQEDIVDWEYWTCRLKFTNGEKLEIESNDNGFYSCKIIDIEEEGR